MKYFEKNTGVRLNISQALKIVSIVCKVSLVGRKMLEDHHSSLSINE